MCQKCKRDKHHKYIKQQYYKLSVNLEKQNKKGVENVPFFGCTNYYFPPETSKH